MRSSRGLRIRGYLGYAYGRAGRREEAEKLATTVATNPFQEALIFAGLGDKDRTFEALDRMTVQGAVRIGRALTFPEFAFLRGDPRVKGSPQEGRLTTARQDCPHIGTSPTPISQMSFLAIARVLTIRTDSSHGFTQGGFLGLPVLCPTLLPGGHDAALCCLPQHPAAWDLYLSGNIFVEEKRVILSSVGYWDRKQRCARLFQVARKRTTVEMESPGEDRCRHVAFRETLDIRGRQQLRKTVPILRSGVHNALCYQAANHRRRYAQNGCRLPVIENAFLGALSRLARGGTCADPQTGTNTL